MRGWKDIWKNAEHKYNEINDDVDGIQKTDLFIPQNNTFFYFLSALFLYSSSY